MLTATDQKPQKSLKRWYYPPSHCLNVNMMLSNFFVIFEDLGFSKIRNFNDRSAVRGQYASLYRISSKSVKRLQRYGDLTVFFSKWRLTAILDLLSAYWDHPRWPFDGLYRCVHLVEIDAVVSITWDFQYFARLDWKRLLTPPKMGFSGNFIPKMASNVNETPKRHILARVRVVWAIKRENPSTGLTCRWVQKKGIN